MQLFKRGERQFSRPHKVSFCTVNRLDDLKTSTKWDIVKSNKGSDKTLHCTIKRQSHKRHNSVVALCILRVFLAGKWIRSENQAP